VTSREIGARHPNRAPRYQFQETYYLSVIYTTARAIIEYSLPLDLTRRERRLAFAKRLYARELPDAALQAFADWNVREKLDEPVPILDRGAKGDLVNR
jgi:hypothetical protein